MKENLDTGRRQERVDFLRDVRVPDGQSGYSIQKKVYYRTWADIVTRAGRDSEENERRENVQRLFVICRNPPGVKITDTIRVISTGQTANIVAIYSGARDVNAKFAAELGVI